MKQSTLILAFFLLLSFGSCDKNTSQEVTVEGRKILVNNTPYFIKGICYHPVPKGSTERDFGSIDEDLQLMVEAGINTVRVYSPIDDLVVLDKIHAAGLKIIVGFGYNQDGYYDILSGTALDYVEKYKNHPSILLWELGNEYNYHPEWFGGKIENWYQALNTIAGEIKLIDQSHPVGTAHGELPTSEILDANPAIDVWGMNVYRWDVPGPIYAQWEAISNKPMYLSEAGADSYMKISNLGFSEGINEAAQATANAKIIEVVLSNREIGSGVALFSFTDGWWKAGNPTTQDIGGWAPNSSGVPYDGAPNEEFWGIVDIDRTKKQTYFIIQDRFNEKNTIKQ